MTNLKRIRQEKGFSQSQLAKASGISVRSIQAYEQQLKDINGAKAITVYKLSKTLKCEVKDLLEM